MKIERLLWKRRLVAIGAAAIGLAAHAARAQQNLFNVPSAEITRPGGLFFQQQFNFDRVTQSNTTISYGLGHGFEVGINVLQLDLVPQHPTAGDPNTALFTFNGQKGFDLGRSFKVGVGTQLGQSVPEDPDRVQLADFSWLVGVAKLPRDLGKLYGGAYYANRTFRGARGEDFGFMLGYDIPVTERLSLVGDYVSGRNGLSVAVLGGVVRLTKHWSLSLGGQLPSPGSGNSYGGVLELTFSPSPSASDDDGAPRRSRRRRSPRSVFARRLAGVPSDPRSPRGARFRALLPGPLP